MTLAAPRAATVSICLPNLNHRPFLEERLETIFAQSYRDWELIVVDGHSDDGSWEYLTEKTAGDPRVRLLQAPREGIYPAWNACISHTRGEYVYIATSDDTMAADCLEKLVSALESHRDCDLAHCMLRAIGDGAQEFNRWWENDSLFALGSQGLDRRRHLRLAPYDGLLHLYGASVYISMTQLLIRRSLLDRVGPFESRWGSAGDFHWNMRATLLASTVHVPGTWGGWRLHADQATQRHALAPDEHRRSMEPIMDDAIAKSWDGLPAGVREGLRGGWREYFWRRWRLRHALSVRASRLSRLSCLAGHTVRDPRTVGSYLNERFRHGAGQSSTTPGETVCGWLRSIGRAPCVVEVP